MAALAIQVMMHMFAVQAPIVRMDGMWGVNVLRDMMGYIIMGIITPTTTRATTIIM